MVASAADHATIIERVLPAPMDRKNVIRLGRIRKPRPLIVEKTMTKRAVRDAAIPRLAKDSLPPVEILRRPCP